MKEIEMHIDFEHIYQYTQKLNILYAEDDKSLQDETYDILENFFLNVEVVSNGSEALSLYKNNPDYYDLIITDINMPVMDGMELIKEIHLIDAEQVIVVVSAYNESSRLVDLIHLGINNFLMKPIQYEQLFETLYKTCKAIYNQKELIRAKNTLESDNKDLVLELSQKNEEINMTQRVSIEAIATMVESYDDETGSHIRRIQSYVDVLIGAFECKDEEFEKVKSSISLSAILHDIGKLMIPKEILTKPEKLQDEEFEIIKQHSFLGGKVLESANMLFRKKFAKDSFLKVAADIAMYHHERWDGRGYPHKLQREEIPLSARVVALADVYDAIRSKRVYKDEMKHEEACDIIQDLRSKAFDPYIVDLFIQNNERFREIFDAYP